jgi:hypothetical protein
MKISRWGTSSPPFRKIARLAFIAVIGFSLIFLSAVFAIL